MGRNRRKFFLKVDGSHSKSGITLDMDAQIVIVGAEVALQICLWGRVGVAHSLLHSKYT